MHKQGGYRTVHYKGWGIHKQGGYRTVHYKGQGTDNLLSTLSTHGQLSVNAHTLEMNALTFHNTFGLSLLMTHIL